MVDEQWAKTGVEGSIGSLWLHLFRKRDAFASLCDRLKVELGIVVVLLWLLMKGEEGAFVSVLTSGSHP